MVNCNVQRIDQLFETKFASKMRQAYPRKAGEFYSRTRTGHSGRQRRLWNRTSKEHSRRQQNNRRRREQSTQNVITVLEQEENERSRCQKSSRAGQEQSTQDVSRHL